MNFYPLTISALEKPIADATTITFDLPEHLHEKFNFQPGQHLVIKFTIDGKDVRRTYSLNNCPHIEEPLQVTVKRVKNGLVSNHINDNLRVGNKLEVAAPQGRFFAKIDHQSYKTYFLFAAGSGITPIISICKSILYASPNSSVNLFFGNTNQKTIIFKEELKNLTNQFPVRLKIVHILSQPKVWTSRETWKSEVGRISANTIEKFITENPPIAQSTEYYSCGPGEMNLTVQATLTALGIPKELIHFEQFGGKIEAPSIETEQFDNAKVSADLNGKIFEIEVPEGKTILQVLKNQNAKPPYSCESGICGTCVAKIIEGKAKMKFCSALDDSEIEKGMLLTCQALPASQKLKIKF